ncbi:MAG: hypothetical protein MJD61_13110, partial [Proteobacteria bacterium]|nr:hypothetical protein [Pseudomonadota bacterium]
MGRNRTTVRQRYTNPNAERAALAGARRRTPTRVGSARVRSQEKIFGEAKPQEKIFGEAKQHSGLDLVATRTLHGNQIFTMASLLSHNLGRELQMQAVPKQRGTLSKRPASWRFDQLGTIRQRILHLAGRLSRPQGELTMSVSDNPA